MSPPPIETRPDPWPARLALAVGLGCTGLLFFWGNPLAFNQAYRWRQLLGGEKAVRGLTFEFVTPSPFGPERLQGAAPLMPETLRNQFFGTAPAGPGLTGTVLSSAFVLAEPWLVIPFAGYPTADGNGLRLRLVEEPGRTEGTEIGCPGPNQDGIAYWLVDVRAYQGRRAKVVLYDGRDSTEAWVAAAPPIPTDNPELATALAQRLQDETHGSMHSSLGVIALVSYLGAFVAWWNRRR